MIDASQKMITMNRQGELRGGMIPPQKRHLELQIKTLETAPRDPDKLERLFESKEKAKVRINGLRRDIMVSYRRD
jgi:hypothetical protein